MTNVEIYESSNYAYITIMLLYNYVLYNYVKYIFCSLLVVFCLLPVIYLRYMYAYAEIQEG